MSLRVLWAGPSSTVQDEGRFGYRRFGVTVAGAADGHAYRLANLIVGNAGGEAVVESTLAGPTVEFLEDCAICVTGARFEPHLNGERVSMYRAILCRAGDVLEMGAATAGCRGYLAVFGGVDVPPVMGSRSTYARAGLGGHMGRALRDGDVLPVGVHGNFPRGVSLRHVKPPVYGGCHVLRVIPGPQDDLFSKDAVDLFFAGEYKVDVHSDRMGVRLAGPKLTHLGDGNIVSEGVSAGAIQIPGDGLPIVLLADAQTTGGYPKIAHVATVDLPALAQLRPGDRLRFQPCSVEDAQVLYMARLREYDALRRRLEAASACARDYEIQVAGAMYRVSIVPADRSQERHPVKARSCASTLKALTVLPSALTTNRNCPPHRWGRHRRRRAPPDECAAWRLLHFQCRWSSKREADGFIVGVHEITLCMCSVLSYSEICFIARFLWRRSGAGYNTSYRDGSMLSLKK